MSEVFSRVRESLSMQQVARHLGFEPNRSGFIRSPFSTDKTASCKLYANSYYDFSSNTGGDLVKFTAAVLGINNWEACKHLIGAFSLSVPLSGSKWSREEIKKRQQEKLVQQEREQLFKESWRQAVGALKRDEWIYQQALDLCLFSPLSNQQAFCIQRLQIVSRELDILCMKGSRVEQEKLLSEIGLYAGGGEV